MVVSNFMEHRITSRRRIARLNTGRANNKTSSDWKLERATCMGRAGPTCQSSLMLRRVTNAPDQERRNP